MPRPLTEDVPRIYPRRLPGPDTPRSSLRREPDHRQGRGRSTSRPRPCASCAPSARAPLPAAQLARPLRKSFQDLGGTFMKFGQIIASSPGMFGDDVADEFRACLDTGPPVPFPDVRQRVEEDLGLSLRDAFAEFEPEPIGTASIAVVHRARLLDGRTVAVKVLRPGHRAASSPPTSTSCSRCSRSWCARPATRWPAPSCSCSTASGSRSARRWTCATRRARWCTSAGCRTSSTCR